MMKVIETKIERENFHPTRTYEVNIGRRNDLRKSPWHKLHKQRNQSVSAVLNLRCAIVPYIRQSKMCLAWKKCSLECLKSDSVYRLQQMVLHQCIQHNVTFFKIVPLHNNTSSPRLPIQIAITISERDSEQLMSRNARILA